MKNIKLLIVAVTVMGALFALGAWTEGKRASFFLWSLSALPIAALFYSVRRANRIVYGLIELGAAVAALFFLMARMDPAELTAETITARGVAILAIVYVMVRALDNIGEGIQPGSGLEGYWSRVFPKGAK